MMDCIKVTISSEPHNKKPNDIKAERAGLCQMDSVEADVDAFFELVGNEGHTFYPGTFTNGWITGDNFESSQVIVADIDNEGADVPLHPKDALERLWGYGLDCSCIYLTFNDPTPLDISNDNKLKEALRYRMIFILDEVVEDGRYYDAILDDRLYRLFPEADKLNTAQIYLGGKQIIYTRPEYRLSPILLMNVAYDYSTRHMKSPRRRSDKFKEMLRDAPSYTDEGDFFYENSDGKENVPKNAKSNSILLQPAENGTIYPLRNFKLGEAQKEFKLLDDFLNCRRKIFHHELFGLYTAMKGIEGGKKLWREKVKANPWISDEKIMTIAKWVDDHEKEKGPIWEQRISGYAPDDPAQQYVRLTEIPLKRNHQAQKIQDHYHLPLTDAEWGLRYIFDEVKSDLGHGTYVLKCSTGLGKSQRLMHANLSECIIAVPTHKLKNEISERLREAGIEHNVIPELPVLPGAIQKVHDAYIRIGAYNHAVGFLRSLMAGDLLDYGVPAEKAPALRMAIVGYFKSIDRAVEDTLPVVTTHKRIMHTAFPNHSCLIVDEDILKTIGEVKSITMKSIRMATPKVDESSRLHNILEKLIERSNIQECIWKVFTLAELLNGEPASLNLEEGLDIKSLVRDGIDGDIISLAKAQKLIIVPKDYKDPMGEKSLHFIGRNGLPGDKKVIILSATASEFIYQKLFDNVEFYDLSIVEMQGRGRQYSNRGFGRSSFFTENTQQEVEKISAYVGDREVITYKAEKYQQQFSNPFRHLENIEGTDELKGKDIAVVGTPNKPPYHYLLWASFLGIDYDPDDVEMEELVVKHNGYRFRYMTFKDPNLQKIQFHFVESGLVQAVGRARLLRTPATVELFSNFPLVGFEQRNLRELPETADQFSQAAQAVNDGDNVYALPQASGSLAG